MARHLLSVIGTFLVIVALALTLAYLGIVLVLVPFLALASVFVGSGAATSAPLPRQAPTPVLDPRVIPPDRRSGVLTQPGMAPVHAHGTPSRPVPAPTNSEV